MRSRLRRGLMAALLAVVVIVPGAVAARARAGFSTAGVVDTLRTGTIIGPVPDFAKAERDATIRTSREIAFGVLPTL